MKILVFGADGFVGRHVVQALSEDKNNEVIGGIIARDQPEIGHFVDLSDRATIANILRDTKPEIVISCAGIVDNSERAELNYVFTSNIIEVIHSEQLEIKQVIITGSAAEYGVVDPQSLPVSEDAALGANSLYGKSKLKETSYALEAGKKYGIPVAVARLFNPLGQGMHPRFLTQRIAAQIQELKDGTREAIELSRLDAVRDYIDIRDVARAFQSIVEHAPCRGVYNVGSGVSTSNKQLLEYFISYSDLQSEPKIVETSDQPEPFAASQADISKIKNELGWKPQYAIAETIKEIVDARK